MHEELSRLKEGAGRDLHPLQIKLTYVGAQLKGIPSVAFTTFFHRLEMEWFAPLRLSGISYGNDDGEIWNFTVTPREIAAVVQKLAALPIAEKQSPEVSLAIALKKSRLGDIGAEILLDTQHAASVDTAILDALDPGNGIARQVMTMHVGALRGVTK